MLLVVAQLSRPVAQQTAVREMKPRLLMIGLIGVTSSSMNAEPKCLTVRSLNMLSAR